MKPIDTYTTLSAFTHDLENSPHLHFPLEIMGQRRLASRKSKAIFHSASMLAEIYKSIPNPDNSSTTMPIQAKKEFDIAK